MLMTTDPSEKWLLAGIVANPDDDAPRLVYADWLDERAEHPPSTCQRCAGTGRWITIKSNVNPALLPQDQVYRPVEDIDWVPCYACFGKGWSGGELLADRAKFIRTSIQNGISSFEPVAMQAYMHHWHQQFHRRVGKAWDAPGQNGFYWHRGFVVSAQISITVFCSWGKDILRVLPTIQRWAIHDRSPISVRGIYSIHQWYISTWGYTDTNGKPVNFSDHAPHILPNEFGDVEFSRGSGSVKAHNRLDESLRWLSERCMALAKS